jgi:tape measure domain-containing protein
MMAKGVELASAYISLSVSTDGVPKEIEDALGKASKPAEKAGKEVGEKFNKGAKSTLGSGLAQSLAKELGAAGDKGSREMLRSLAAGHKQAERDVQVTGRRYAQALQDSMRGGGRGAADKWEGEFKKALNARNASQHFFDEFERSSTARGQKVGTAVGTVVGKGIGAAMVLGIGAATAAVGVAVGGVGLALTKGFQRLKKIDDAEFKLRALGNTTADVEKIMKNAEQSVKGTAFALDEAASAAASAVAAGVKPGEELANYLTTISDTAAIAGTSFGEMASIFNKVRTNNKAYTDDLQMLADRGVPIFQYLQRQYGVSAEALQKMVEDGKVTSADFNRALDTNLTGAAKKMGDSVSGSIANVEAALGRLGAKLLEPVFGSAAGGLGGLQTQLDNLGTWVDNNQATVIGFWADSATAATYFGESVLAVIAGVTGGLADLVNAFGDTLGAMTRGVAFVNRILGRDDVADQLDADADAMFGWADSLHAVESKTLQAAHGIGGLREDITRWKEETTAAAEVAQALGDALVTFPEGQIRIDDINIEKTDAKLDTLGIKIVELPDGSTTIEAKTEEGQAKIDAFIDQNNPTAPAMVPVEPQTAAAEVKMQDFIAQWSKAIITPTVAPNTPGYTGGADGPTNPLTAPLGKGDSGGVMMPNAAATKTYFESQGFQVGGYSPADSPEDEHQTGEATDVMVPSLDAGNAVLPNALRRPGVQYVIWNNKMWYPDGSSKAYNGPSPHTDHLHIRQKASGGSISGPGSGTSDSIPAMLSNGEHVLTAKEVALMGGQGGVYAFRNALHRKTGGEIAPLAVPWGVDPKGDQTGQGPSAGPFPPWWDMDWMPPENPEEVGPGKGKWWYRGPTKGGSKFKFPPVGTDPGMRKPLPGAPRFGGDPRIKPWGFAEGGAVEQWKLLAQQAAAAAQGDQHGQQQGAAPGPQQPPPPGERTEGYIPAAAGNTAPVGQGGISNVLDLGESAIHGLIDTGAQVASMAVSAAAAAGSFGAGAAAGPAASTAINMGADAAKRGVSYLYDLGGIWAEAGVEQLFPFGAPRWLGSADPMAFMPNIPGMGEQEKKAPGTMGAAATAAQSWAQPGNPAIAGTGTPQQSAKAAFTATAGPSAGAHGVSGPGAAPTPGQGPPPPGPPPAPPAGAPNPMDPSTWLQFGGIFDKGGMLPPNSFGVNLSKKPEPVLSSADWKTMKSAAVDTDSSSGGKNGGDTHFHGQDNDEMFRRWQWEQRRKSRTSSGRP